MIPVFLFISDLTAAAAAVITAALCAGQIDGKHGVLQFMTPALWIVLIPLLITVYLFSGQYRVLRGESLFNELPVTVKQVFSAVALVVIVSFFYRERLVSRPFVLYFAGSAVIFTFTGRLLIRLTIRSLRRRGRNLQKICVVGEQGRVDSFCHELQHTPGFGYEIEQRFYYSELYEQFDRLSGYAAVVEGVLFFLLPGNNDHNKLTPQIMELCKQNGLRFNIVPDLYSSQSGNSFVYMLGRIAVIDPHFSPLDIWYNRFIKRLFDLSAGALLFVLTLPLQLLVATAVKLGSKGPVIFVQKRVGLDQQVFKIYKFRTMFYSPDNDNNEGWTVPGDPRVTRIGRLLRRSSLDELPQLINVLRGEMTLVGPRPEQIEYVNKFRYFVPDYLLRHSVKTGITGWAQVLGLRGDTSVEQRVQADLYYIKNWSIGLDVKILFLTVLKGMLGKNAY